MKIGYRRLIEDAEKEIETISAEDAKTLIDDDNVLMVDLRDIRELAREGKIPNALHAPRGMLEFWVDPDSPYFQPAFGEPKRFVFYCKSGWRSALATQTVQRMGLGNVCHIGGGFDSWCEAGGPVEEQKRRP